MPTLQNIALFPILGNNHSAGLWKTSGKVKTSWNIKVSQKMMAYHRGQMLEVGFEKLEITFKSSKGKSESRKIKMQEN